jgi:hypothetical protein
VRDALSSVLARREFRKRAPSLTERLSDWAERWLERLGLKMPSLGMEGRSFSLLQFIVSLIAVAGFLCLIGYFVRRVRVLSPETIVPNGGPEDAPSASDPLREADARAASGEYRAALERAYIGTLLHLGDRKLLDFRLARTNWENLRALKPSFPEAQARSLQRISRLFDRKWYGMEEMEREEYDRAARELAEARRVADEAAPESGSAALSKADADLSAAGRGSGG